MQIIIKSVNIVVSQVLWGSPSLDHLGLLTQRKGINGAKQVLGPKKKQTPKCNTPQKKPAITKKIAALHKIF